MRCIARGDKPEHRRILLDKGYLDAGFAKNDGRDARDHDLLDAILQQRAARAHYQGDVGIGLDGKHGGI